MATQQKKPNTQTIDDRVGSTEFSIASPEIQKLVREKNYHAELQKLVPDYEINETHTYRFLEELLHSVGKEESIEQAILHVDSSLGPENNLTQESIEQAMYSFADKLKAEKEQEKIQEKENEEKLYQRQSRRSKFKSALTKIVLTGVAIGSVVGSFIGTKGYFQPEVQEVRQEMQQQEQRYEQELTDLEKEIRAEYEQQLGNIEIQNNHLMQSLDPTLSSILSREQQNDLLIEYVNSEHGRLGTAEDSRERVLYWDAQELLSTSQKQGLYKEVRGENILEAHVVDLENSNTDLVVFTSKNQDDVLNYLYGYTVGEGLFKTDNPTDVGNLSPEFMVSFKDDVMDYINFNTDRVKTFQDGEQVYMNEITSTHQIQAKDFLRDFSDVYDID